MEFLKKISIRKAITNNFWLKIISLIIAGVIWFYISRVITEGVIRSI